MVSVVGLQLPGRCPLWKLVCVLWTHQQDQLESASSGWRHSLVEDKQTCVSPRLQSQLDVAVVELKDLICEREKKVEEVHNSLLDIQVSYRPVGTSSTQHAGRTRSLSQSLDITVACL